MFLNMNTNTPETEPAFIPGSDSAAPAPEPSAAGKEKLPVFAIVLLAVAAFSLVLYLTCRFSVTFSDFYNLHIAPGVRIFFSYLTVWIPFSLAECMLLFLPVAVVFILRYACTRHVGSWRSVWIFAVTVLSVIAQFFSIFALGFNSGYTGSTLDAKMGLDREAVAVEDLKATTMLMAQLTEEAASQGIVFADNGFSVMPYGISEMSARLVTAYDRLCEECPFIVNFHSRVKPVMLSEPWTYTHITGVYTYFTGEANLNVNMPDYTLPFTAAHEMAHQRGIAREDEANFIAYLVCLSSDDPYIRYSGVLNMFEYLGNALYSVDSDGYFECLGKMSMEPRAEMSAYNTFFAKYRKSVAAKVTEVVNDTYLKTQGTVGTRSYGMVVDLCVAYYKSR